MRWLHMNSEYLVLYHVLPVHLQQQKRLWWKCDLSSIFKDFWNCLHLLDLLITIVYYG